MPYRVFTTTGRFKHCHSAWQNRVATTALGFTLIEVIVALVISAILFAIALPNFRSVIQNYRITSYTNDLIGDLNLARSEAIKRSTNVGIVCVTRATTVTPCTDGAWENGRIIFVDANNDNAWSSSEAALRTRSGLDETNITIRAADNVYTFDRRGALNGAAASIAFTICDDRGLTKAKRVIVNNTTGQIRMDVSNPLTGSC